MPWGDTRKKVPKSMCLWGSGAHFGGSRALGVSVGVSRGRSVAVLVSSGCPEGLLETFLYYLGCILSPLGSIWEGWGEGLGRTWEGLGRILAHFGMDFGNFRNLFGVYFWYLMGYIYRGFMIFAPFESSKRECLIGAKIKKIRYKTPNLPPQRLIC